MEFSRWKIFLVIFLMITVLTVGFLFVFKGKYTFKKHIASISEFVEPKNQIPEEKRIYPQKLANPPSIIKAVYATGYSAGLKRYKEYLKNLFETTQINAVVVDIKGSDGFVTYSSEAPEVKKYNLSREMILDIDEFINFFHSQNIYVIGRVAVFEDPQYSKARPEISVYNTFKTKNLSEPVLWKDNNGLSWLDPASKDAWDYVVSLAKDGFLHGFDEINFDYIRYPSDGNIKAMGFPVSSPNVTSRSVIRDFFRYLRSSFPEEKISADLFGQTTTTLDDMGIGQLIEDAFENFDYVCPMIYPSHYINGYLGYQNPAEYPYEVVKFEMDGAKIRRKALLSSRHGESVGTPALESKLSMISLAKIRPWLQDFNMGADYTAKMVKNEITATSDSLKEEFNGYMLWNPSNVYTSGAVLK